jgi:TRAP-type C4-dicarboxylate transport system permease small subunit
MRYFFNRPINGAFDLTEYLLVIVFAAALPYCTLEKGHICVDILTTRLPKKVQKIILGVTAPFIMAMFSLITWQTFNAIGVQYNSHIVSSNLLIPRYPFVAILFLGYVCFMLIILADFFKLFAREAKN